MNLYSGLELRIVWSQSVLLNREQVTTLRKYLRDEDIIEVNKGIAILDLLASDETDLQVFFGYSDSVRIKDVQEFSGLHTASDVAVWFSNQVEELKFFFGLSDTEATFEDLLSATKRLPHGSYVSLWLLGRLVDLDVQWTRKIDELDLDSSELRHIPDFLGELTGLTELDFSENQLSIVPELIGNLKKLEILNLDNNLLRWLPEEIVDLTNLVQLNLHNNQLTDIPQKIDLWTQLEVLTLHSNQLKSIPEEIGNLKKLNLLSIQDNSLMIVPDSLCSLKQLVELNLGNNAIQTLPMQLGQLTQLRELHIGGNQLTELPSLSAMSQLKELWAANNRLQSLPDDIGKLVALERLDLRQNQLEDIPRSVVSLTQLKELNLKGNPLSSECLQFLRDNFGGKLRL